MQQFLGVFRVIQWVIVCACISACTAPTDALQPRETVPAVLYITPAPTLDVNATVTAYAEAIVPTGTPSGMYTVKSGDTLSALAEEFEVNLEDLMAANQLTDAAVLQVGQALIIPSLVDRTPRPAPTMGPNDVDTPTATPVSPTPEATATP
ncbi:MAG: LysM peptidoglycan-binding domain-containing protein [Roseiflexaceae bacterium]|jgi:LysM repeat protein|nr:LysM peptidoglycan-binding domain-containing protein [Chloroflexaceae bacterium]MCE2853740.1 LysM peptidoglycan-binding domain-containing protein [Chloroflexaceae bacterium]